MRSTTLATWLFGLGGLGVGAILAAVAVVHSSNAEAGEPASTPASPNAIPVIVELFTSEGCSSCPSADDTVARLARSQPVQNARIIVLAHHVDYWNSIGWPDPYSTSDATRRQSSFASLGGGNYTPQAVVDGRAEMVGSRGGAIEDAIGASAKRAHAKLDLDVVAVVNQAGSFNVTARVGALPAGTANDTELLIAIVQDRGRVAVPRGENSGRTLDHVGIARSLKSIGNVANAGASLQTTVQAPAIVAAPDGSTFSVVAFVQERKSRAIIGASSSPLTSKP
jgi:hypothetical protein